MRAARGQARRLLVVGGGDVEEPADHLLGLGPGAVGHRELLVPAAEQAATLVLWGDDYDGGHKAWIRWEESGEDDIVPGSQVVREDPEG